MFVYQPKLNVLELQENKYTEYVIGLKSKGVCTSKLTPLHTEFLHNNQEFSVELFGKNIEKNLLLKS